MSEQSTPRELSIPLMPGFRNRILPILLFYWLVTAAFTLFGQPIALAVGSWATVTTIMLWPVGRSLGKSYTSYRPGWFIIGVASMIGVPLFGYLIIASTDPLTKYISLIGLAVDIGVWGIPASTMKAFSRPITMLFRPDLIFGDGRLLAGGIVSVGLGMVSVFGPPGVAPKGNWFALFSVVILALIQIIPLRGMWKMRNRISRLLSTKWDGYLITTAKELYLVLAITALMFSFHNFFGGVIPFTRSVIAGSNEGLAIMVGFALFIILVRSWYKQYRIGDPFIVESLEQGLMKHSIFAVGLIGFLYGYVNVMIGGFPRTPNNGNFLFQSIVGTIMLAWGILLLVPVRSWAQHNQRRAMMRQMVEIMLPKISDELRAKAMGKVIGAVSRLSEKRRLKIVRDMVSFISEMELKDRERVLKTQIEVVSSLPQDARMAMMKAMDHAMMR